MGVHWQMLGMPGGCCTMTMYHGLIGCSRAMRCSSPRAGGTACAALPAARPSTCGGAPGAPPLQAVPQVVQGAESCFWQPVRLE